MEKPKIGAVKPLVFFKEVKVELGKVVWPTRQETIRLTMIVILISVAVGLFIGALDILFTNTIAFFLKK